MPANWMTPVGKTMVISLSVVMMLIFGGRSQASGYDQEAVKLGPPCTWTGLNLTTDQQALEDFRDSLPEPNSLKNLWQGPVCPDDGTAWQGILCFYNRVAVVRLGGMNITGTLPASFASLSFLYLLNLHDNHLSGTLPPVWSCMKQIRIIDLRNNNLTGTLPSRWSHMTALQNLTLSNNHLSGTLPASWPNMTTANTRYSLSHNLLRGTLPSNWSTWQSVEALDLAYNRLSGTLPPEYSNMTRLKEFNVQGNFMSGQIPSSWSMLGNLTTLSLASNNLQGWLPENLPAKLYSLDLSHNSLNGTLPAAWSRIHNMTTMTLVGNSLRGTLPPGWSSLSTLHTLSMADNGLTGELPGEWFNMTQLQGLDLYQNYLRGSLPPSWYAMPNLLRINVSQNNLSGPLPPQWANLTKLSTLELQRNNLEGPLPISWAQLGSDRKSLTDLDLSSNQLTGSIPPQWFAGVSSLRVSLLRLSLASNLLHGSIPVEATNAGGQHALDLMIAPMNGGGLCGTIPPNVNATSQGARATTDASGLLAGGPCPTPDTSKRLSRAGIAGVCIGAILCAALAAVLGLLLWRRQLRRQRHCSLGSNSNELVNFTYQTEAGTLKFEMGRDGRRVLLGKGSFGKVYKARWQGLLVAVKILSAEDSSQQDDFRKEVAMLEGLRHTHIVNYLGHLFQESGEMMLITELMQGGDLGTKLRNDMEVPRRTGWYRQGCYYALGIARGFVYLHSRKIIWFDCKPSNVLLDHSGMLAKIADVGLCKMLAGTHTETALRGTLGYMAPELMGYKHDNDESNNRHPVTMAVDIYSYGLLLWAIITGEQPRMHDESLRKPRVPEECPPRVMSLYLACTALNPQHRPTAFELMETIEECVAAGQAS